MLSNVLYVITGQSKELYKEYSCFVSCVVKKGYFELVLLGNYIKSGVGSIGLIVKILVIRFLDYWVFNSNQAKLYRYYSTPIQFLVRNIIIFFVIILGYRLLYSNMESYREFLKENLLQCVSTELFTKTINYYPYTVVLLYTVIMVVQLSVLIMSKSVRNLLKIYLYDIILWNIISLYWLVVRKFYVSHSIIGLELLWEPRNKPIYSSGDWVLLQYKQRLMLYENWNWIWFLWDYHMSIFIMNLTVAFDKVYLII